MVENAFDKDALCTLLEERALAHDSMDASRVHRIREEMKRAEARVLQADYVESFFLEAFKATEVSKIAGLSQVAAGCESIERDVAAMVRRSTAARASGRAFHFYSRGSLARH